MSKDCGLGPEFLHFISGDVCVGPKNCPRQALSPEGQETGLC